MRLSAAGSLLLVLLLVLGCLGACSDPGPSDAPSKAEPTTTPTPLAAFDTSTVSLARTDFCGLLPESAIDQALGGSATKVTDYVNGERATVAPGVHDVAHEFDCTYRAGDRTTARAWVFAPQVTTRTAHRIIRDLGRQPGCTTPEAADFGKPSTDTVCTTGTSIEAAYHGLFVDAWLSCSVQQPGADRADGAGLLERAGQWCVQVAAAVDTSAR